MAKGSEEALTQLYARYYVQIYKLSFHYLQNKEDAEETVQDVFLNVFKNAGKFQNRSAVHTWIYKITVNKCLDKLRFRKAKNRMLFLTSFFSSAADHLSHQTDNPTEVNNLHDDLYKAIDTLGEQQKTALILTQIQELSIKETAIIMRTSPKAVESLTQRAKANLKKKMKK
jgi:RNA polymerase sigma-70 factor (ECF subfamily)